MAGRYDLAELLGEQAAFYRAVAAEYESAADTRIRDFEPVRNARIERPLADIVSAVVAAREALAESCDPDGTDESSGYNGFDEKQRITRGRPACAAQPIGGRL